MDDRMFTALANHERHLADCIDSKYRGKEHNDAVRRFDEPAFETFSQGIVPSGMRVRPDYDVLYIKPLTIEQSMQLPSADVPLDLIEKASDLEPIPLGELQLSSKAMFEDADDRVNSVEQLFQQPTVAVPRYSYTSGSGDHRVSISALAIDWSLDMLDYDAEGMEHLDMGDDIGIIPQNNVQSLSQPTNESYEI